METQHEQPPQVAHIKPRRFKTTWQDGRVTTGTIARHCDSTGAPIGRTVFLDGRG